jgi:hypothetical protein
MTDSEVLNNACSSAQSGESLQEAFSKFRSRKIQELKLARFNSQENLNRSIEYKNDLRNSFIQSAMGYIGVPYSKRYKEESTDDAPLYLDCCGLVRKAVQDNQDKFGFLFGRWNQCYQMDTLPIVLEFKDLKPGDLIFYEGKYLSTKHKPQKHDNVHVEIFLGGDTGEATIGARMKRGVVSVFPSYKFESSSWSLVRYHFRSIETWLEGQCVSHCPEHNWIEETSIGVGVLKSSIFYESDGESAGDVSEDDEDTEDCHVVDECDHAASPTAKESALTPSEVDDGHDHTSIAAQADPKVRAKSLPYKTKKNAHTYYVNKSNGWKLVKDALDKRGWQQLPFEDKRVTRFDLKWYYQNLLLISVVYSNAFLCAMQGRKEK